MNNRVLDISRIIIYVYIFSYVRTYQSIDLLAENKEKINS